MLEPGLKGIAQSCVERANTALELGSGSMLVYGTPALAALMERSACEAIACELEEGVSSVGIKLELSHDAATPVGMEVRAEATLTEVDGRRLVFEIDAFDERGPIGKCRHERFLVQEERFLNKTYEKL